MSARSQRKRWWRAIARRGLPIVLTLAVAPTAVSAQSFVCHAVQRGDTASRAAQRLTGNSRNKYQPWFQIMAPSGSFVPKSQYDRVRAGWRACVVARTTDIRSRKAAHVAEAVPPVAAMPLAVAVPSEAARAPEVVETVDEPGVLDTATALATVATVGTSGRTTDLTVVWLGAAIAVPWFGWRFLDGALDRRRRASFAMRHFADRFVREFERPLIQEHARERPVRVQFRASRFGRRFEILLAPGARRRYPNLSDHKQNVEYDVTRVLQALADDAIEHGPLHADAEWVVMPFQLKKAGSTHRV